jgi:hypothetical protein
MISKKTVYQIAKDPEVRSHSRAAVLSLSRAALSARRAGQEEKKGGKGVILFGSAALLVAGLFFWLKQKEI